MRDVSGPGVERFQPVVCQVDISRIMVRRINRCAVYHQPRKIDIRCKKAITSIRAVYPLASEINGHIGRVARNALGVGDALEPDGIR